MKATSRVSTLPRAGRTGSAAVASLGLAAAGMAWLAIAGASAWLVFATPMLARVVHLGGGGSPLVGAAVWAVALTAPACFAILGIARLAGAADRARGASSALPPVTRRAADLPAGCFVIAAVRLPDDRRIPDVVVGPHGIAFFERLPPRAAARRSGDRWEVRFSDGSWRPIENPLHRAARDGERLRRHLEAGERDFVVRVNAAVLGDGADVGRIDGCAVVALDDVPAWLSALPVQRGLTPERVAHLREVLAALT